MTVLHFTAADDPFTRTQDALRTLLLADVDVAALVKPANVPDLVAGKSQNPIKSAVQDADLPELVILPNGGRLNLGRSNTDHGCAQSYLLRVDSGQVDLKGKHNATKWAIIRALARLYRRDKHLSMPGLVARWAVTGFVDTFVPPSDEAGRGMRGWVCVWTLEIEYAFCDTDIPT